MTGTIDKWHIWMANVGYEDSDETKERPVLIMNNSAYLIIALKMTSTYIGDERLEYRVKKWEAAGLSKETSVRLDKRLRLNKNALTSYVGKLCLEDIFAIENRLTYGR